MGKKGDLSDFECGMVVDARRAGLSILKRLIYWDFHTHPSLGLTEKRPKKRKYPVSGNCVDENALLMSEENGQNPAADVLQQQKTTPGAGPVS